jgi:hypothetical protein
MIIASQQAAAGGYCTSAHAAERAGSREETETAQGGRQSARRPGLRYVKSMASLDDWLESLVEVAAQQPSLVAKKAHLRYEIGGRGSWSILCDPGNATAPVVVTALGADEPADAASADTYDCCLRYESEAVWSGVVSGELNPRAAMKDGKMSMEGSFRVVMALRGLLAAAGANGGDYDVQVTGAAGGGSGRARRPAAAGPAVCCAAPGGRMPLGELLIRVERRSDGMVGEGIRSTAEYQQLQASCMKVTAAAVQTKLGGTPLSIERGLKQLLVQAASPDAAAELSAVWSFARLPSPTGTAAGGSSPTVSEERVAKAEAENAALRAQLNEVESALHRGESPLYSIVAAFGLWWLVLALAALACSAAMAHATAFVDGSAPPAPVPGAALILGLILLGAWRLSFRARVRVLLLLTLVLKLPRWLGLLPTMATPAAAGEAGGDGSSTWFSLTGGTWTASSSSSAVGSSSSLLGLRQDPWWVLAAVGDAAAWGWSWAYPALTVVSFVYALRFARAPKDSPVRKKDTKPPLLQLFPRVCPEPVLASDPLSCEIQRNVAVCVGSNVVVARCMQCSGSACCVTGWQACVRRGSRRTANTPRRFLRTRTRRWLRICTYSGQY